VVNVRFHQRSEAAGPAPAPSRAPATGPVNRLNLLLSYAGWKHESWADRLPRLLEPMGVFSLRALTGAEASKVIAEYPIHVAVVDLGLPLEDPSKPDRVEEAGPRLLDLLRRLDQPPPTVVVKRGRSEREDCREINAALRAGAFAVIDRPDTQPDLERLLDVLRRCLIRYYHGRWPGGAV